MSLTSQLLSIQPILSRFDIYSGSDGAALAVVSHAGVLAKGPLYQPGATLAETKQARVSPKGVVGVVGASGGGSSGVGARGDILTNISGRSLGEGALTQARAAACACGSITGKGLTKWRGGGALCVRGGGEGSSSQAAAALEATTNDGRRRLKQRRRLRRRPRQEFVVPMPSPAQPSPEVRTPSSPL